MREFWIKLVLFFIISHVPLAFAQQALVRVYENPELSVGQAFLTHAEEVCYAILPQHVVEEAKTPSFLAEGSNDALGEADFVKTVADDIVIARLNGRITRSCGFGLATLNRTIGQHLQNQGLGVLKSINSDGTVANLPVSIIDNDGKNFLHVQASNSNNPIQKGQSGSMLIVNSQIVGMLLSVKESSDGNVYGKVMRLDRLLESVETALHSSALSQAEKTAVNVSGDNSTKIQSQPKVTGWTALPVDNQHLAANLIMADATEIWRAKVKNWPTEIEISLGEEKTIISGITFDGSNVERTELPASVEIFVNVNEKSPAWRSLAGRGLDYSKTNTAVFNFAPVWARQIKLNFGRSQGKQDLVSLNKIRIIKPN